MTEPITDDNVCIYKFTGLTEYEIAYLLYAASYRNVHLLLESQRELLCQYLVETMVYNKEYKFEEGDLQFNVWLYDVIDDCYREISRGN